MVAGFDATIDNCASRASSCLFSSFWIRCSAEMRFEVALAELPPAGRKTVFVFLGGAVVGRAKPELYIEERMRDPSTTRDPSAGILDQRKGRLDRSWRGERQNRP